MKKSRIVLLGGLGFVLLAMLSLMIFFRLKADDFISSSERPESFIQASGISETRKYDYKDFKNLHFDNLWDISIKEGNDYSIEIRSDKALLDEIEVSKKGDTLLFSYDQYIRGASGDSDEIKAFITMPIIEEILFMGMGNIVLEDFSLDELTISNSGASNIEAVNVFIDQLNLIVNGAANANLENIEVKNCDLDISGAANIELNMAGGKLTGSISGAASVSYGGSVSEEKVSLSGIGSLERH